MKNKLFLTLICLLPLVHGTEREQQRVLYYGEVDRVKELFYSRESIEKLYNMTNPAAPPLFVSAKLGYKKLFFALLALKESGLTERNAEGDNLLWAACLGGNKDIIRYVADHNPALIAEETGIPWTFTLWEQCSRGTYRADVVTELLHQNKHIYGFDRVLDTLWETEDGLGRIGNFHESRQTKLVLLTEKLMRYGARWQSEKWEKRFNGVKNNLCLSHPSLRMICGSVDESTPISAHEWRFLIECVEDTENELYEKLRCSGIPLEQQIDEDQGFTPLLLALSHHQWNMAKALIKLGANVNATDFKGNNALYYALMDTELCNILIQKSPQLLNAQNCAGKTAVEDYVLSMKNDFCNPRYHQDKLDTIDFLLTQGAHISADVLDCLWIDDHDVSRNGAELNYVWGMIQVSRILLKHGYDFRSIKAKNRYRKFIDKK